MKKAILNESGGITSLDSSCAKKSSGSKLNRGGQSVSGAVLTFLTAFCDYS